MYYTTDVNTEEKINLKEAYPNWAFPSGTPDANFFEGRVTPVEDSIDIIPDGQISIDVDPYLDSGVYKSYRLYTIQTEPNVNEAIEKLVVLTTPLLVDDVWTKWNVVALSEELKWDYVRLQRDWQLINSDWTQASDSTQSVTAAEKVLWATFREELRNLPATYATAEEVVFPTPPADLPIVDLH
jgi:hypothetical protein